MGVHIDDRALGRVEQEPTSVDVEPGELGQTEEEKTRALVFAHKKNSEAFKDIEKIFVQRLQPGLDRLLTRDQRKG